VVSSGIGQAPALTMAGLGATVPPPTGTLPDTISVIRTFLDGTIRRGKGGRVVTVAGDAGWVGGTGEPVPAGAGGGVITFFASDAASFIIGQVLSVSGGRTVPG